jgi:hypothetical protein
MREHKNRTYEGWHGVANSEERIAELGKLPKGKIRTDWSLLDEAYGEPFDELMELLCHRESVVACMQAAKCREVLKLSAQFARSRRPAVKPEWRASVESIVRHLVSFGKANPRPVDMSAMPIKYFWPTTFQSLGG